MSLYFKCPPIINYLVQKVNRYTFLIVKNLISVVGFLIMKIIQIFIRQKTVWRLTWFSRFIALFLLFFIIFLTRGIWKDAITSFIIAPDTTKKSDAILIEGWKYPQGAVLRAAIKLKEDGIGKTLFFVEYLSSSEASITDLEIPLLYHEMLNLYFKSESVDPGNIERIFVELKDPVTWNTAFTVMKALSDRGYRSLIIVSPWAHSRRSCDVYSIAGKKRNIEVTCRPVEGGIRKDNWWRSHMGMSMVLGEVVKRIYYIFRIS